MVLHVDIAKKAPPDLSGGASPFLTSLALLPGTHQVEDYPSQGGSDTLPPTVFGQILRGIF